MGVGRGERGVGTGRGGRWEDRSSPEASNICNIFKIHLKMKDKDHSISSDGEWSGRKIQPHLFADVGYLRKFDK